jgi:CcmD family protein
VTAAEKYVAAAYLVVFLAVVLWVVIISAKLSRLERELEELTELAARRRLAEPVEERAEVTPVG